MSRLHHIGVVVPDIDLAVAELATFGYVRRGARCADERQGIDFQMMSCEACGVAPEKSVRDDSGAPRGEYVRDDDASSNGSPHDIVYGAAALELIQPRHPASVVSDLLTRDGPGPYHLCFEVEAIHQAAQQRVDRGYSLVLDPSPSPLFDGRLACFLYHEQLGLVELLESGPAHRRRLHDEGGRHGSLS